MWLRAAAVDSTYLQHILQDEVGGGEMGQEKRRYRLVDAHKRSRTPRIEEKRIEDKGVKSQSGHKRLRGAR